MTQIRQQYKRAIVLTFMVSNNYVYTYRRSGARLNTR